MFKCKYQNHAVHSRDCFMLYCRREVPTHLPAIACGEDSVVKGRRDPTDSDGMLNNFFGGWLEGYTIHDPKVSTSS